MGRLAAVPTLVTMCALVVAGACGSTTAEVKAVGRAAQTAAGKSTTVPSMTSEPKVESSFRVPAGWVAKTLQGDGLSVTFWVPPAWQYSVTPPPTGDFIGGDLGYLSSFPMQQFCGSTQSGNVSISGCEPQKAGRFPANGIVMDLGAYTPSGQIAAGQIEPGPALGQGNEPAGTHEDAHDCVGSGAAASDTYTVPDGEVETLFSMHFCYAGPLLQHMEQVSREVVQTAEFRPDPSSPTPTIKWGSAIANAAGTIGSSSLPLCTQSQVHPAITTAVQPSANGDTSLMVTTTYSETGTQACGVSPLGTCAIYGAVGLFSSTGEEIWQWEPLTLSRPCDDSLVVVLPTSVQAPTWRFNSAALPAGSYFVRAIPMGSPATVAPLGGSAQSSVELP